MKNLILVALILQLVITVIDSNGEFKFGDIVAFYRKCGERPLYKHYGIYVGSSKDNNVGQGDNDIFHLTGETPLVSQFKFGKFEETRGSSQKVEKDNYLDDSEGFKQPNIKDIEERIKENNGKCTVYGPLNNNCEHFATRMRYGMPTAKQSGTMVEPIFSTLESVKNIIARISEEQLIAMNCQFTNGM